MSQGTPNGRITIAVVGNKVDNLTAIVLNTNRTVDNMRRELGESRQVAAVNEERWRNHDTVHESSAATHADLHKRERGVLASLILIANGITGGVFTWWANR